MLRKYKNVARDGIFFAHKGKQYAIVAQGEAELPSDALFVKECKHLVLIEEEPSSVEPKKSSK